uniref:C2H2-type domain-containing protein n=1 Tax=Ditylenchus dipsaci TaxID=166011 RepID=A0A915D1M2_9BILA
MASPKEGGLEKPVKRQRTPSIDNKIEPTTTTLTPAMAASEIEPKVKSERKSDKFKGDHKKKQKPDRKEKTFDIDKIKLEPMEVDGIKETTDTKPPPAKKALLNRIPKLSERQKQQKPFQSQSQPLPAKDHVVHHNYKPASQQHQNSQQQNFQSRQQQQHGQSPNANIQPTVALGSHAFVTTAVVNPPPVQMPPHSVATTFRQNMPASVPMPINTFPSALPPHSTGIPPPNFTPISMPPHAVSGPPPVLSGPPPMSVAPRDANVPPSHVFFPPPSTAPLMMGNQPPIMPTMPPAAQAPVITNDTPRLSGVPLNNRIFVDGRAYEVFYLADTAVIERNGLPHRVSFNGPPRDVIIDGTAHRMAFGESKTVVIDGEAHVLRFGAPSRELYMGNFPFKGIFGGAPIVATINGRRHEIRLCGPAPEVKIEQDPSYDLTRHMPTVRQQSGFPTPPPKIVEKPKTENMDVTALLQKLQSTGVLTKFFPKAAEAKRPENITSSSKHNKAHSPPIPSNQRLDNIQKMAAPMSSLDQFSMRSLVIRYDNVVAAIHQSRFTCGICGIGFKEMYTAAYQRHSEWHLKDMIDSKDHKYNRSRPWFMTEEWFTYSETEEANKLVPTDEKVGEDQTASGSGQNSGDALSEAITLKKCSICGENFEEYFDEDDDVWKLKDSEVEDGKAFHRSCKADASKFQPVEEEEPKESVGVQGLKFDSVILDQLINKTSSSNASVSPSTFVVVNNEEQGQQHPSDGLVAGTSLTQHFKQEL